MTARRVRRAALAALLAIALPAAAARPLDVSLSARDARLSATLDLARAFPTGLERQLGNGLTNVVAVYVTVTPAGGRDPALFYGRLVEILYDVWDEVYLVTVKDAHVPQGVRLVLPDFDALRRFLSDERDLDLGPVALVPKVPFVVEARVEVNPVSKEQLQRTREYIANPSAGARAPGGSRSVLGAMASYLLREPDPGSDVHVFRSRPIGRSEVVSR